MMCPPQKTRNRPGDCQLVCGLRSLVLLNGTEGNALKLTESSVDSPTHKDGTSAKHEKQNESEQPCKENCQRTNIEKISPYTEHDTYLAAQAGDYISHVLLAPVWHGTQFLSLPAFVITRGFRE